MGARTRLIAFVPTKVSQPIVQIREKVSCTRLGRGNRQVAEDSYEVSALFLAISLAFCYHLLRPIAVLYTASQLYKYIYGAHFVEALTLQAGGGHTLPG